MTKLWLVLRWQQTETTSSKLNQFWCQTLWLNTKIACEHVRKSFSQFYKLYVQLVNWYTIKIEINNIAHCHLHWSNVIKFIHGVYFYSIWSALINANTKNQDVMILFYDIFSLFLQWLIFGCLAAENWQHLPWDQCVNLFCFIWIGHISL